TNIMTYPNFWEYKCNFVGSIAYVFDMHLQAVCNLHGVEVGKILRSPIEEIFHFIIQREASNVDF
ncbi:MAG: N-acetylglucosamine kinase, partial [Sphingobacterium sp.]|nr:N-acetylglucosamine kinase [Sphingobacterium sp.]